MAGMDDVRLLSKRFRTAIECSVDDLHSVSLREFPRGSCGDVSDMLGVFLHRTLKIDCEYVSGWHEDQSHAWLEVDHRIVDITADQFKGNEAVIVSADSSFHRMFKVEHRRIPDFSNSFFAADLWHDYELLVTCVQ